MRRVHDDGDPHQAADRTGDVVAVRPESVERPAHASEPTTKAPRAKVMIERSTTTR